MVLKQMRFVPTRGMIVRRFTPICLSVEYKPTYLVRLFHLKKIVFRYPTINMTKSPIHIVALPDIQFLTNTMIMNKVERFIIAETWNAVDVRTEINVSVVNLKEN